METCSRIEEGAIDVTTGITADGAGMAAVSAAHRAAAGELATSAAASVVDAGAIALAFGPIGADFAASFTTAAARFTATIGELAAVHTAFAEQVDAASGGYSGSDAGADATIRAAAR